MVRLDPAGLQVRLLEQRRIDDMGDPGEAREFGVTILGVGKVDGDMQRLFSAKHRRPA